MRALLDTHVLIWWTSSSHRLPARTRDLITDSGNELYWSVASTWELVIKEALGKVRLPDPPRDFLSSTLARQSIQLLPILQEHALEVHNLAPHHRDPFDRMLVAQARTEGLVLVSGDAAFGRYPVATVWQ